MPTDSTSSSPAAARQPSRAALVLRRLAGDLVKTTILTPDEQFVHLPMTVLVPFSRSGGERHSLDQLTGAADAVLRRGTLASVDPASREIRTGAGEILACAGVAGLEALLALRALLGDQVDITVVAPEVKFVNRSMTVARPSMPSRRHGLPLRDVATDLGADWRRGTIDRVAPARRTVVTGDGTELLYDRLVLAMGARAERQWHSKGVLTYHGRQDRPAFRLLLRRLREGGLTRLAFVKPVGATWPLPLYDLALTTAVELRDREVELSLITPEREPLEVFGSRVSASIRELLDDHGVALHADATGVPSRPGRLHVSPGNRRLSVDRIVTLPRLVGPGPSGVPAGRDGFIATDAHGRVAGLDDVFAAGDATAFAIKQGGLATQQADAAAEAIAASLGADIDPDPFRPVLRGVLLAGNRPHYLRADISGSTAESSISEKELWWPPNRLCGRYLAPYLSRQVGFASDVMPQDELSALVGASLDPGVPDGRRAFATLRDLQPR